MSTVGIAEKSAEMFLSKTPQIFIEHHITCIYIVYICAHFVKFSYHRLRGSGSPVLTATGFVNGKGQCSTPHRIDTPQPITKKFVTGDYVGDPTAMPN